MSLREREGGRGRREGGRGGEGGRASELDFTWPKRVSNCPSFHFRDESCEQHSCKPTSECPLMPLVMSMSI